MREDRPRKRPGDVAGVILAAGSSTRFGSQKQRALVGELTMLQAVAGIAARAGLAPIIVVVPPQLAVPPNVVPVTNAAPQEGLSRSLRLGIEAVPPDVQAAVILLGDQPTLDPAAVRRLVAARGHQPLVATSARGVLAPPVLIERDRFALAHSLTGDSGLRDWLRAHPDEVLAIEVGEHAPDIDTPADLERLAAPTGGEPCPGCHALFEPMPDAATHEYVGSSPACWAAFGELAAREFGNVAYGRVHRHTVDVYMVQHPGERERRQRQSVALHLIGLCHWLEHDMAAGQLNPITQALASEKREWPWLEPPPRYPLTVRDVLQAATPEEHARLVREWGASVWDAWSAHHGLVRGWAADALNARR